MYFYASSLGCATMFASGSSGGKAYLILGLENYELGHNQEALANLRDALILGVTQADAQVAEQICRKLDPEYYQTWDQTEISVAGSKTRQDYDTVFEFLGRI